MAFTNSGACRLCFAVIQLLALFTGNPVTAEGKLPHFLYPFFLTIAQHATWKKN